MSKHTISGFIIYRTASYWNPDERVTFSCFDPRESKDADKVLIREHSFDVDVPDNFDPRPSQVEALRAAKEQARAEFAAKVTEYDRKITDKTDPYAATRRAIVRAAAEIGRTL